MSEDMSALGAAAVDLLHIDSSQGHGTLRGHNNNKIKVCCGGDGEDSDYFPATLREASVWLAEVAEDAASPEAAASVGNPYLSDLVSPYTGQSRKTRFSSPIWLFQRRSKGIPAPP
ncbi:hypothetical protein VOLCADRAFT_92021 [Volvox carteri f. nagariensis]|uniref:Uncharacterized protein n=1 Tax=Volvox carteri f. nagariensis TaxID=3068 RepID=D8TYW5_VOLCA|nr:uncharacterized protein VOLCADRAFT_92021 [Volvox carteri f. nagariensis]EFJ47288.1 hypothetical protein VOLCADRAFT_92021 [Volvox carteri f. nagariensis]|eukprot:XP_002951477.1 hypothetical protein VOLCADRAFT_92021 [Volvox carteri f. nagariensis]